eukprot:jgi/Galph1/5694/GphlegSOOS_G4335.1
MQKVLRLAVVGTGRMGKIHIYNAATSLKVKLLGVYDIPERREEASRIVAETGSQLYEDWESQVLANKELDAVVIASPTHTHEALTLDALESGKSVLCEKPLGDDWTAIQICHQKAKEKGLTLLVDWNRRLDPSFMKLVSEIRKGFIGHLQIIRVSGRDHPVPPLQFLRHSNSCIFRDMIVHDVDLVRWIMSSEPISVYATATNCLPELAGSGIYDTATAVIEFGNGVVAMLDSARNPYYPTWVHYGYEMLFPVHSVFACQPIFRHLSHKEQQVHNWEVFERSHGYTFLPNSNDSDYSNRLQLS